jgi:hypothetical protein
MRTSRFTDSQILAIWKETEGGQPVPSLCHEHWPMHFGQELITLEGTYGPFVESYSAICVVGRLCQLHAEGE